MKQLLPIVAIALLSSSVRSQTTESTCPPSTSPGIHIVQPGETLYGISKKYKISIDQLSDWNGIKERTLIRNCASLIVSDPSGKTAVPKSYSYVGSKSSNKSIAATTTTADSKTFHTVTKGETLSGLAEKYGYTLARFMKMNNMSAGSKISVGQVIKINDCACSTVETTTTAKSVPQSYSNTPKTTSQMSMNVEANGSVKPFSYNWNPSYAKVIHVISQDDISQQETPQVIGNLYGLTSDEVLAMNGLDRNTPLMAGQRLTLEDRRQLAPTNYVAPDAGFLTPADNVVNTNNNVPVPTQYNTVVKPKTNTPTTSTTAPSSANNAPKSGSVRVANNTAMTEDEMQMVHEVNLIRSNPAAYVQYIEQYVQYLKENGDMGNSIATAKELIDELKKTAPLSILQTVPCLYDAAKKHGDDQRKRGDTNHQGSDGSWPWDRVTRECKDMKDGNENLVGGPSDIRRAVILLLVDDGIEGRGHRKTLLQPDWQYIACHKMGTIGNMPNCWVQQFGY